MATERNAVLGSLFTDEVGSMSTRTGLTPPHAEYFPPPAGRIPTLRWWATLRGDVQQVARFWPVIQNMVSQELQVRYQRSVLGFVWTLLNPILMMLIMTIVFSKLLGGSVREYAVHLFAGMVPWGLLAGTINECAFCILQNEGLIRKIYLPKLIFPLVRLLINITTFSFSLIALYLLLMPMGASISWSLVCLPIITACFAVFALGLGLIVAVANTFFRDCSHLVGVLLQAWYFATPIIYRLDNLPPEDRWKFWLNPAYPFIHMFQTVIRDGLWPDPATLGLSAVIAVTALGVGYAAFKSYEDELIFRL
jgi:ABC-type polysaccharide/polyol phosphate export permease